MDAVHEHGIDEIVIKASAQVGKTTILKSMIGYYSEHDPSTIMVVMPILDLAESFSKDRLAPMIRDSRALVDVYGDPMAQKRGNTLLHKIFTGGHITLAGANSAASLSSRPIRILLCDEVDRYPASAGDEGDPVNLARKRTTSFWDSVIVLASTPTTKGASRIDAAWENSDKRRFYVDCPCCGADQILKWENVKWDDSHNSARYKCSACAVLLPHYVKAGMLKNGRWVGERETDRIAGFHLNELYSPWRTWSDVVADYLEAQRGGPEMLRTWTNTSLGETYEEVEQTVPEWDQLIRRTEEYDIDSAIPSEIRIITAGVDVQANRLAIVIRGWSQNRSSWLLRWGEIYGDPEQPDVWRELLNILRTTWGTEDGRKLRLSCMAIDSGFKSQIVYDFAKSCGSAVMAVRGVSGRGKLVLGRPTLIDVSYGGKKLRTGGRYWPVGTDVAKTHIFGVMHLTDGANVYRWHAQTTPDYFQQLTAEKCQVTYRNGVKSSKWVKISQRNEALDCEVYALAAAHRVGLFTAKSAGKNYGRSGKNTDANVPAGAKRKTRRIENLYS